MSDTKTTLDPIKVNEVLLQVHDLFDRAQIPLLALKDTGKQIKETSRGINPDLHLVAIELGVRRKDLTQSGVPMLEGLFKMYNVNYEWTSGLIRFVSDGIPVYIKIIHNNYAFIQNPERVFYRTCEFNIPNPFDNYYKARHIVR